MNRACYLWKQMHKFAKISYRASEEDDKEKVERAGLAFGNLINKENMLINQEFPGVGLFIFKSTDDYRFYFNFEFGDYEWTSEERKIFMKKWKEAIEKGIL